MSTVQHILQHTRQRAYKTELALNHEQISACKRHAGAARWAYNWGLARKQEAYRATGTSPSAMELHRELNALKPTHLPWIDPGDARSTHMAPHHIHLRRACPAPQDVACIAGRAMLRRLQPDSSARRLAQRG